MTQHFSVYEDTFNIIGKCDPGETADLLKTCNVTKDLISSSKEIIPIGVIKKTKT